MTSRAARIRALRFALAGLIAIASLSAGADEVARGDSAWERRAEGEVEGLPQLGPIEEAVAAYEQALAEQPERLEASWKLLRALHFAGDFATQDPTQQREIFDRAIEVSEAALALLSKRTASGSKLEELEANELVARIEATGVATSDVARLYFWSAINWGAWSRSAGLLRTVQQGVAERLRRYALVTIALEPGYECGGAFRLLGRLHAKLPRVPFLSGWVDRSKAIPLLDRAYELSPSHPGNSLLLALTLLDLDATRRAEALELLEQVAALEPRSSARVEDLVLRRQAREELVALRAEST